MKNAVAEPNGSDALNNAGCRRSGRSVKKNDRTWRRVMHQHAVFGDVIDVVALDFEVEDGFGVGQWNDSADDGRAVECFEMFAFFQLIGADEGLAVLGPEGMIGRCADWLVITLNVDVEDLGGLVLEGAGDDAEVGVVLDWRAGFDRNDFGSAFDAAFGDVDFDRAAGFGLLLFQPHERTQELHVGERAVGLAGEECQLPPRSRIDGVAEGGVLFTGRVLGGNLVADFHLTDLDRFDARCGEPGGVSLWPSGTQSALSGG